jgi:hypothetical protein
MSLMNTMNRKHRILTSRATMTNLAKKGKALRSLRDQKTRTHQTQMNRETTRNPAKKEKAPTSLKDPKNQMDEMTQGKHAKENDTRLNIFKIGILPLKGRVLTVGIPVSR